jgi:uncharacterized secreted protein with C-terminal beta-propeller domain
MSDKIFRDMAEQMKPSPELVEGLLAKLDDPTAIEPDPEPIAAKSATRDHRPLLWLSAAACLVVVSGFVAVALRGIQPAVIGTGSQPQASPAAGVAETAPAEASAVSEATAAASEYADIYAAVAELRAGNTGFTGSYDYGRVTGSTAPVPMQAETAAEDSSASNKYQMPSGTNVQVTDIDEGDLVKTDGRAIYVAKNTTVSIVSAQGAKSKLTAKLDVTADVESLDADPADTASKPPGTITDLMIHQSTLVVLYQAYTQGDADFSGAETYVPFIASELQTLLYDISDLAAPAFLGSFEQSGNYTTSRLSQGVLYLVSSYSLNYTDEVDAARPETFVPQVGADGVRAVMLPADVKLMPKPSGPSYAVVTAVNLANRSQLGQLSVLGGAETVYMSAENLYLAASTYAEYVQENTRVAPVYLPETTHLIRIALNDGAVKVAAEADVSGRLLNQFALDEYDGHLRIAVQTTGETGEQTSALRIFDNALKEVGKIADLAAGETIESVRFQGEVGYLVTYLQVDPLFAIDLSDPANPKVLSALKIPGFSTYLHPWGEGLLLGFGSDGDGILKLSMFDVSDPVNVSEITSEKIPAYDSEALGNHHAIWVDPERKLIGFPTAAWDTNLEQSYWIYEYTGKGFQKVKELALGQADQTMARGIVVEGQLYVATRAVVAAYALDGFGRSAEVKLD